MFFSWALHIPSIWWRLRSPTSHPPVVCKAEPRQARARPPLERLCQRCCATVRNDIVLQHQGMQGGRLWQCARKRHSRIVAEPCGGEVHAAQPGRVAECSRDGAAALWDGG
jgi:hypothetical protein